MPPRERAASASSADAATRSSPARPSAAQERHEQPQPVALGRQDDVADADRREERRDAAPLARPPPRAKRSRSRSLRVSTRRRRPVSGSTSQSSPTFGSSCSRASRISTATHVVARGELQQLPAASRAGRGSPRRRRPAHAGGPRPPSRAKAETNEVGAGARGSCSSRSAPSSPSRPGPALARRQELAARSPNATTPSRLPRRVATCASASATPSATSALRRSAVPNCIEARRVEHDPGRQHALREMDAYVRYARARGDVPVDPPHVVAGLVRAHLSELGAHAEPRRAVVAGEQAFDPAPDRQVERAQQRPGERPGARARRVARRLPVRAPRTSRGGAASEVDLRHRHRRQHLVEDRVGLHLLGQRPVREHEPVPERVLRELLARRCRRRSRGRASARAHARLRRG